MAQIAPEGGPPRTASVLAEVAAERARQDETWGEQNHPDGTGGAHRRASAAEAVLNCNLAFEDGDGTWRHILTEEYCEALAESDPARLRTELVQVAATAVNWIESIDRRQS